MNTNAAQSKEQGTLAATACYPANRPIKPWHTKVAETWIPESTLTLPEARDLDNICKSHARPMLAQIIANLEPDNAPHQPCGANDNRKQN